MNGLMGLTGYMMLGFGAKAKPAIMKISDTEILVAKDGRCLSLAVFISLNRFLG